jgi:3-phosphoshikimate 1-carboxyvinyltransferase
MQAIIDPGFIQGEIHLPASKSMMQRVCAAALLHHGKTIIYNPGNSNDDKAALHIIQQLGAKVSYKDNNIIEIESDGIKPIATEIHCGESGLSARLFIAIASLSSQDLYITGSGSLLQRPMTELMNLLPQLGVTIKHIDNNLPFHIQGPLQPKDITIDGSLSSQYLSGVLFALAASATAPVTITVLNLTSKPYIDLTLQVLSQSGYDVSHDDYKQFYIKPKPTNIPKEIRITIESDWSSAAYWLVAGAIGGDVTVHGLNTKSTQADKAILDVLKKAGARLTIENETINVKRSRLKRFEFDATHCPDLFPILAILAACCKGESMIRGVHRLVHKESNRAASIAEMLDQYDVAYFVQDDSFYIRGKEELEQASVDAHNDHRIAMAAAIGALKAVDTVIINGSESVNKSYPEFFSHLQSAGIDCTITD